MRRLGGLIRTYANALATIAVVLTIFAVVSLLPPDTSLAQIRQAGLLNVCVPDNRPPLVTGDARRPGLDVELLKAVAQRLGVGLKLNVNSVMGSDFNPLDWHINRSVCEVIAGGLIASSLTRSFLDTSTPYLESGWAVVMPPGHGIPAKVGFYPVSSGLDRIALGETLRKAGIEVELVDSPEALVAGINSKMFDAGVTEAVMAGQIAGVQHWQVNWLSNNLERAPIAFGLWKGDLTLKRAFDGALADLEKSGAMSAAIARYDIAPVGPALLSAGPGRSGS